MDPGDVVRGLIAAIESGDRAGAHRLLAPDMVMEKMPSTDTHGPFDGVAEVDRFFDLFGRYARSVEWEIQRQLGVGELVMHERVDRIEWLNGVMCDLPVAGVFVVREGVVVHWRDYFDSGFLDRHVGPWAAFEAELRRSPPINRTPMIDP
ncbi:MAG: limonene-1,2-epoxide hydrolase family protein [Acidimicrobiia bacterium]